MIREREEKASQRDEAVEKYEAERKRLLDEARAEADALRAAAKREADEERARLRKELTEKPLNGLRDIGLDPKQLLEAGLREDDPEYQRAARMEKLLAEEREKREAIEKRIADWDKQTQQLKEESEARDRATRREQAEKQVWELAEQSAEKDALFQQFGRSKRSFILAAHAAADELVQQGIGVTPARVVEYMAIEARKELGQPSQVATVGTNGNAPKAAAKPTTLGAQDASTRRSGVARFDDLSEKEQDAELVRVASEALKSA